MLWIRTQLKLKLLLSPVKCAFHCGGGVANREKFYWHNPSNYFILNFSLLLQPNTQCAVKTAKNLIFSNTKPFKWHVLPSGFASKNHAYCNWLMLFYTLFSVCCLCSRPGSPIITRCTRALFGIHSKMDCLNLVLLLVSMVQYLRCYQFFISCPCLYDNVLVQTFHKAPLRTK